MGRLLLFVLLSLPIVFCCIPLQKTSYRHAAHLSRMNLSIFYDKNFEKVAEEVACRLKNVFAHTNLYHLNLTSQMADVCIDSQFVEKLRFLGLIQAKCNLTANLLHFKAVGKRWLAHLITRRSDIILDIGNITKDLEPEGLNKALELMLVVSGPVLTLPETGIYKTRHKLEKKKKHEEAVWIKFLVGVGVGSLVCIALTMAIVLGTVAWMRRAQRKEQKSQQLAEKTQVQEGQFIMDFGHEEEEENESRH